MDSLRQPAILFLIFLLLPFGQLAKNKVRRILIDHLECPLYNPKIMSTFNCSKATDFNGSARFNVDFTFAQDMTIFHVLFDVLIERHGMYKSYFNMEKECCGLLTDMQRNFVLNIFTTEIRKASNLPRKCPYKKHFPYRIHEFHIDPGLLPSFLPEVKFKWNAHFKYHNDSVCSFIMVGRVKHFPN